MAKLRIIARLDIKHPNLIKGIRLEGLRVIGDPAKFASEYYQQGIDELIYMDIVASLYNRNNLSDLVRATAKKSFVPMTVGGGVRSVSDAKELLRCGADKIAINTAAIKNPQLITELSKKFGAQCVVLSIEAKKTSEDRWQAYHDNGREETGIDAVQWAIKGAELGAGEILLTSVDREGTSTGFDVNLVKEISTKVDIPVIASGGYGKLEHLKEVVKVGKADAVAIADALHYKKQSIASIKDYAQSNGIEVRVI